MYMSIVAKKRAAEIQGQSSKPKYEYDSDEETDGGTWEHKKRKKEMQKTRGNCSDKVGPKIDQFRHNNLG